MASQVRNDKAMIESPNDWPRWPILPMKRYTEGQGWPDIGVIHAARPLTVWKVSMFDKIDPKTTDKIEYESIDDLLAYGWVVD